MGRAAQISREAVLAAALRLADADGLDAVTMHAVARQLRVTPMALYRHVDDKNALLDGLVEVLLGQCPLPPDGMPWDERLTALAAGIREVARRHPASFPLLLTRPAVTPAARAARDTIHAALREGGLPEADVARAERLISTAVLGFAVSEATGRFRQHDQSVVDADFAELLRWLGLVLETPRSVPGPLSRGMIVRMGTGKISLGTGKVSTGTPTRLRSFDPVRLADLEYRAWTGYYLRKWPQVLRASFGLVRLGFGMDWFRTVHGAWLVLRANQLWAPYPDNHLKRARACMRRFYGLVRLTYGEPANPAKAAELEVDWWRVHREIQHEPGRSPDELVDALVRLYTYLYGEPEDTLRPAAVHRAKAMELSDQWVEEGCQPDSELLPLEHAALVRAYAALLAAVHH